MHEVESDEATGVLINDVQTRVRGGASLSDSLEGQGKTFSSFYISMIRAAEASGSLHEGLQRLTAYLESSEELRDKVVSALICWLSPGCR